MQSGIKGTEVAAAETGLPPVMAEVLLPSDSTRLATIGGAEVSWQGAVAVYTAAIIVHGQRLEILGQAVGATAALAARRGGKNPLLTIRLRPHNAVTLIAVQAAPAAVIDGSVIRTGAIIAVRDRWQHHLARCCHRFFS